MYASLLLPKYLSIMCSGLFYSLLTYRPSFEARETGNNLEGLGRSLDPSLEVLRTGHGCPWMLLSGYIECDEE